VSTALWRIATDTPDYTATDMGGTGAKLTGGRWNRQGWPVIYAASSIALACLETVVHLNTSGLPLNRYLVRLDVPPAIWKKARKLNLDKSSIGWDALPAGRVSLDIGERWLAEGDSALFLVPSIVIPEEFNVLVNPAHPDARHIRVEKLRKFTYDARLYP